MGTDIKGIVTFIAKALVDCPDDVSVEEIEGEQTSVIELRVAKDDMGKVIGKQGRTIAALRVMATAICAKYGWRAQLEIVA